MNRMPPPEEAYALATLRKDIDKKIMLAAATGDPIAGAVTSLLFAGSLHPATQYVTQTGFYYGDEDTDDDIRPF